MHVQVKPSDCTLRTITESFEESLAKDAVVSDSSSSSMKPLLSDCPLPVRTSEPTQAPSRRHYAHSTVF